MSPRWVHFDGEKAFPFSQFSLCPSNRHQYNPDYWTYRFFSTPACGANDNMRNNGSLAFCNIRMSWKDYLLQAGGLQQWKKTKSHWCNGFFVPVCCMKNVVFPNVVSIAFPATLFYLVHHSQSHTDSVQFNRFQS